MSETQKPAGEARLQQTRPLLICVLWLASWPIASWLDATDGVAAFNSADLLTIGTAIMFLQSLVRYEKARQADVANNR